MTAPTAPTSRLEEVARRLSGLPRAKQDEFVGWLAQRNINVLSLPIVPQVRPALIPLSFTQQRLWLVAQLHPESAQYNIPRVYALDGALDRGALARALTGLVARHEALRTTFAEIEGQPAQLIHEPAALADAEADLPFEDLTVRFPDASLAQIRKEARVLADAEASLPFDLVRGPLFRARLLRLSDQLHWLCVTSHHIVMDEWADAVVSRELVELYDAARGKRAPKLPALPIQYADFSLWQRRWLTDEALAEQLAHWRQALGGGEELPLLLPDLPPPAQLSDAAAVHRFRWSGALLEKLRAFSARAGTTLYTTVLALFQVALYRQSGNPDLRIGSPIANRHRREVEGIVGCFSNTQVLRAVVAPGLTFTQHLEAVKKTGAAAQQHQDLPFERLVEELAPERDLGQTPLFQVMLSWHRGQADAKAPSGELTIGVEPVMDLWAKFDLVLHVTDDDDGLIGELLYRSQLYSAELIQSLAERLERLAAAAIAMPELPISRLPFLSVEEAKRAVLEWNHTAAAYPELALHQLVERWAQETPDAPAVQFESERISYRELDARAGRIAAVLASRGVGREDTVGLCLPRSLELITGLLAILKCGAAYVALDPRTPAERLRELVADAGARQVLATGDTAALVERFGAGVVDPRVAQISGTSEALAPTAGVAVSPEAGAYVIYTSGSTGRPKGVLVSHRAIVSYAHGLLARLQLPSGASMALVSTPTADLGHTVLFGALVAGGLLHVVSEERCFDPDRMSAYMREHGVDVMKITPSHLGGLLQAAAPGDVLPRHTLVLGGEAAPADLLARVRRHGSCRIVNHYGPTETTVGVLTYDAGTDDQDLGSRATRRAAGMNDEGLPSAEGAGRPLENVGLPLGHPLPNRQTYVLDAGLSPVPPGVFGELYIGGDGGARGYVGRPDATADRFIPDPFRGGGQRLYRTGDRARYRADGAIEFFGRTDDQIKIRGHRVEPGEIRAALVRLAGIADAALLLREGPTAPRLVAYLIAAEPGATLEHETISSALAAWLPEHMVPAEYVWLDKFPLTGNGKLDRKALPEPGKPVVAKEAAPKTAPRTELELLVAQVWKDVLAADEIGVDDNFFSLGGDSLLAFQVVARLRKAGVILTIPQLFANQTISALVRVAQVKAAGAASASPAKKKLEGEVALTPIQRWFFEHELARPEHYNQSVLLELRRDLDPKRLETAMEKLVAAHDGLRLRFVREGSSWKQSYAEAKGPYVEVVDVTARQSGSGSGSDSGSDSVSGSGSVSDSGSGSDSASGSGSDSALRLLADAANRTQRSFSLSHGPLLRAVLLPTGFGADGQTGRLLLVAHHLVVDGVSWRILLEDLAAIYAAVERNAEPALPEPTSSYQAWSRALTAAARTEPLTAEAAYWREVVAAGGAQLPTHGDERDNTVASTRTVSVSLDEAETAALLSRAPAAYRTRVDDLLLTALALALCEQTGSSSALINLENHGRESVPGADELDVSRTVGWFTATHPLRLSPVAGDLAASIKRVKEALRAVPRRGVGYGLLRYLGDDAVLAAAPAPTLTFNYLGQFDQTFDSAAPFQPASEPTGAERDPASPRDRHFDVIGMIEGRRLHLDWQYSPALHSAELVGELAERYLRHLRAILAHCTAPANLGVTPSDFPLTGLDQAGLDALVAELRSPINELAGAATLGDIAAVLPLTPIQEGILFHCLAALGEGLYITQRTIELDIAVDREALDASWQEVADSHDVLRTGFVVDGLARPLQIVWQKAKVPVELVDARHLPAAEHEAELLRVLAADRARGFDLARPSLMRVTLLRLGEARYQLIWTDHHLLLDGWSAWRVLSEVLGRYQSRLAGEPLPRQRTAPISDYVAWLDGMDRSQAEAFWRGELGTVSSPTRLAPALAGSADPREEGFVREELALSRQATEDLRGYAAAHSLTINTLVQAALALTAATYTNRDDLVLGITVSGRSNQLPGIDQMVGLFINTLPLRFQLSPGQPLLPWLVELQTRNAALREHEHTPLLRAQSWAGTRGALFDTLLIFENYPIDQGLGPAAELLGIGAIGAHERTNYPLALEVSPGPELRLQLDANLGAVSRAAARQLVERIAGALIALSGAPDNARLGQLSLVTAAERAALAAWNHSDATRPEEPRALSAVAMFEAQVAARPYAVAVDGISVGGGSLTYRQLDARATALAWRLRDAGVGPESIVGLCAPRSLEQLVGLIAIWKAGAAYLPLDPEYPASRIEHMVSDAAPAIILAGAAQRGASWGQAPNVWTLDTDDAPAARGPLPRATSAAQLAYCIYTSGSTGVPKGVTISHANLLNFLDAMERRLAFTASDSFLSLTSLSFDIAALELWLPLTRGGRVVLAAREEAADAERLLARLAEGSVTCVQATPTTWRTLARKSTAPRLPASRRLLAGGEALPPDLAAALLARAERLINVYGPTETTVWSTSHWLDGAHPEPSIGRPLDNQTAYVLDASLRQVPPGLTGELYLGGLGLGRGYHRRAALTAERFLPDPFSAAPGARMYRTGDLARHRADGTLECLGRTDDQIKLRGHRIELGEIETKLRAQPGIAHAVVAARTAGGGEPQLVAYVVLADSSGDRTASESALRASLKGALPDVMHPQRYLFLAELPRTANGKLDRKSLPAPDEVAAAPSVAPRDERERALAELWSRVLGKREVGVLDDFFAAGGDSLVALQLVTAARGAGFALTPRDLFEHPTIAQLAAHLARIEKKPRPLATLPAALLAARGYDELSALAESRVIGGLRDDAVLTRALAAVEGHHEALRLRVTRQGGALLGLVGAPAKQPLLAALSAEAGAHDEPAAQRLARAHEEARRRLNLAAGPSFVATRVAQGNAEPRLVVTAHALAVDAASWKILLADLETAYRQLAAGEAVHLPEASDSLERWLDSEAALHIATPAATAATAPGARRHIEAALDEATAAALAGDLLAGHRAQLDELVLAALAGTPAARQVQVESALRRDDRAGLALDRLLGACTPVRTVSLATTALGDAAQLADALAEQARQLRPAAAAARGSELSPAVASAPLTADLLVRFLGELDGARDVLTAPLPHALVVTAASRGGRFTLAVEHDARTSDATADALLAQLHAELRRLTTVLADSAPRAPRPDDFAHVQLDSQELDDLFGDLS